MSVRRLASRAESFPAVVPVMAVSTPAAAASLSMAAHPREIRLARVQGEWYLYVLQLLMAARPWTTVNARP